MSHQASRPSLKILSDGERTVVRLVGYKSLHEDNVQVVDAQIIRIVEDHQGQHLVLDLETVEYLTSSALGKFVALNRRMRQHGGRLTLTNVGAGVSEVLAVTRLNQILEIHPIPVSNPKAPDCLSA